MIKSMCSTPTLLDGLVEYIDSKNVDILQIYNGFYKFKENKIIIFCYVGEYFRYNQIDGLLCTEKFYYETSGHLKNYYIFVSPHEFPKNLLNEYADTCSMIFEPLLYSYYTDKIGKINYKKNVTRTTHFLSLNNRASTHRQSLYYFIEKFSLKDKIYYSYLGDCERTEFTSLNEISNRCVTDGVPWYLKNLDLLKLNLNIPIKLPYDTFSKNDWTYGQEHYYNDTFCSIVFETYVAEQFPFFTEKTFKPIAFFHPFILVCNSSGLGLLRQLGFKTFGDFWDESYDELTGNQRLEAIFHLILEIANWSQEKINLVYDKMLPILEHNHNHFYNTLPKLFEDRKIKLFNEIKNIVHSKQGLLV
jgi:hypothetical protein